MKRHPESPFYSPNFLKKGSLSQNPYTPSSHPSTNNLQRNSSTMLPNPPPPRLNIADSQASDTPRDTLFSFRTPRIETPDQRSSNPLPLTIVASPSDHYETVYKADFGTNYSSPKVVQAFSPSRTLSQDLSPLADDLAPKKRLRKRGEYSPNREFKAHPKEATFVERIGERYQPPRPDSRAHIEAPRSRSNYRLVATHFYKPLEADHGENAASYSPSRLAKSVLDYYPPHSRTSREGSASRNVESLAYDRDFSPDEAKITSKVGRNFSSVTNRIRTAGSGSPNRRPCSTEPSDYLPIAAVLANSYGGEDERIFPTRNYSSVGKGIGSNAPKIKRYQSSGRLHGRRESPVPAKEGENKANLTRNPTPQVQSSGHRRNVSSVSVNARQAQPEQSQVNDNRQKIQERRKGRAGAQNQTGSVSVNKTTNSFSTLKVITVSVDKGRPPNSMSVKSLRPPVIVPRRTAGAGRTSEKSSEKNSEKNSNATMVVSHEKKKPIRGGTFGSPMIKRGLASNMEKSKLANIKSTINIKWK